MIVRPAEPRDAARMMAVWNPQIRQSAVTFTTVEKTEADLRREIADCHADGRAFLFGCSFDTARRTERVVNCCRNNEVAELSR